jgi:tyrosyl-tRNA synthetase
MVEFTFLPVSSLKGKKEFRCPRKDEEDLVYNDIESLKTDYANDVVRAYNFLTTEPFEILLTLF